MFRQVRARRAKKPKVGLFRDNKPLAGAPKLRSYLEKNGPNSWKLFFCRGPKCSRGPAAKKLSKMRCSECIEGRNGETLVSLLKRIYESDNPPSQSQEQVQPQEQPQARKEPDQT